MSMYKSLLISLPMILALGCGGHKDHHDHSDHDDHDDHDDDDDDTGEADPSVGEVRLAHFGVFPDDAGTEVDVFVNGEASGITFGFKETTGFVELPAGSHTFDIVPAGGAIDDSVFTVEDFDLQSGSQWSIYAAGYVASDAGSGFTVNAIQEDRVSIPEGQVRVEVVHAAALSALDPIDVWVVTEACEPDSPLVTDFEFNTSGTFDLPSTGINVGFDVGQDGTVDACFKIPDVGITDDIVTVYAVNTDGGDVSLIAHLPDGTNAEISPEM
jgi:hypothetical protein